MTSIESFDVVVVGGGPAGATAANELARRGRAVLMLDRAGRIKPCGGAIPPRAIRDFEIPDHMLCAKIRGARMVSPKDRHVDMPIDGGFVGMVNREQFDEWLRERAASRGAIWRKGTFERIERDADGSALIVYQPKEPGKGPEKVRARAVIGADGANSAVGRQELPNEKVPFVFAYHEIIKAPTAKSDAYDPERCDVYYKGEVSPDFYGWIFPHGDTASIGTGSAHKGFSLRDATALLRKSAGLDQYETIRHEGAPIPMKPLNRWDNGKDVVVVGDAAGVVAPASGEGIYYALECGRLGALGVNDFLTSGNAADLAKPRQQFMKAHGNVFRVLGMMQHFWYSNDNRRERFVRICEDADVQQLTWDAYMNKELVRAKPLAHVRIFFKNILHLTGLAPA